MKTCPFILLLLSFLTVNSFAAPLPASEVFKLDIQPRDPNAFTLNLSIKPGYFIYRNRIKITPMDSNHISLGQIFFPKSSLKTDSQGRQYLIYREKINLAINVLNKQAGETILSFSFQGCSDEGFCYPPELKQIKLAIGKNLALNQAQIMNPPIISPPIPPKSFEEKIFTRYSWPILCLIFLGFGLLLSLTPCMLPMVPVLSGIIVKHNQSIHISTRKSFLLSFTYVVCMSLAYAIIGLVVALFGSNLQVLLQSPLTLSLFSLMFIILACGMFGLYDLTFPGQSRLALNKIGLMHNNAYLTAGILGFLSVLILSPCVTPPLVGAITYISQTGNLLLGSMTLFSLGFGMGIPLLVVGTSLGKLLPKAGPWMNEIKIFFGVLLVGVALSLLNRILPPFIQTLLWGSLFLIYGFYLWQQKGKMYNFLALLLIVYSIIIFTTGSLSPIKIQDYGKEIKLDRELPQQSEKRLTTLHEINQALEAARGNRILLDFYADWCVSCTIMETSVFGNPQIQQALKNTTVLKIDLTKNTAEQKNILKRFKVIAPPSFLFYDVQGKEITSLRLVGEISPPFFLNHLQHFK